MVIGELKIMLILKKEMKHVIVIVTANDCPHCHSFEMKENKDNSVVRTLEKSEVIEVVKVKVESMTKNAITSALSGLPHGIRKLVKHFPIFIMLRGDEWEMAKEDPNFNFKDFYVYNYIVEPNGTYRSISNPVPPTSNSLVLWVADCVRKFHDNAPRSGHGSAERSNISTDGVCSSMGNFVPRRPVYRKN